MIKDDVIVLYRGYNVQLQTSQRLQYSAQSSQRKPYDDRHRPSNTVLRNLEIGMQFRDSENAQCNLEIVQIPRLQAIYIHILWTTCLKYSHFPGTTSAVAQAILTISKKSCVLQFHWLLCGLLSVMQIPTMFNNRTCLEVQQKMHIFTSYFLPDLKQQPSPPGSHTSPSPLTLPLPNPGPFSWTNGKRCHSFTCVLFTFVQNLTEFTPVSYIICCSIRT